MILGFQKKYVKESVYDTDMLKLKTGEVARVSFIDKDIVVVYRHWVSNPADPDNKQRNNGYYKCFGRKEVLFGTPEKEYTDGKGEDPEHCEFCKRGVYKGSVGVASRGFATHILRYYTDTKGNIIPLPGSGVAASVICCKFSEKAFNRISTIAEENSGIKLGRLDLKVTCVSEQYQNWDIDPFMPDKCIWYNAGDAYQQYVSQLFEAARVKEADMELLLANIVAPDRAHQLCEIALNAQPAMPAGMTAPPPIADTRQLADLIAGGAKPSDAVRGGNGAPAPPVQTATGFIAPPTNFKPPTAAEVFKQPEQSTQQTQAQAPQPQVQPAQQIPLEERKTDFRSLLNA